MTLTFSFGRQFQPARSAILSPSFSVASTVGALGRESFAYSRYPSAVYVFVAGLAQGYTVGDIVAQFLMVLPRLDVVRLNFACSAALLTGVIVALVNSITPLAVLVSVAFLVGVLLALRCVAALLTTVLGFELSVSGMEGFAAPLTSDECLRSVDGVSLMGTLGRAKTPFTSYISKRLTTHDAGDSKTIVTLSGVWILGYERLTALTAHAFGRLEQWGCSVSHNLHCISAYVDLQTMERWAQHTGRGPVLVE